jgi:hypothetical protein
VIRVSCLFLLHHGFRSGDLTGNPRRFLNEFVFSAASGSIAVQQGRPRLQTHSSHEPQQRLSGTPESGCICSCRSSSPRPRHPARSLTGSSLLRATCSLPIRDVRLHATWLQFALLQTLQDSLLPAASRRVSRWQRLAHAAGATSIWCARAPTRLLVREHLQTSLTSPTISCMHSSSSSSCYMSCLSQYPRRHHSNCTGCSSFS